MKSLHGEKAVFEGKEIALLGELFGAATDIVLTKPRRTPPLASARPKCLVF
jgi:hypothetical protein